MYVFTIVCTRTVRTIIPLYTYYMYHCTLWTIDLLVGWLGFYTILYILENWENIKIDLIYLIPYPMSITFSCTVYIHVVQHNFIGTPISYRIAQVWQSNMQQHSLFDVIILSQNFDRFSLKPANPQCLPNKEKKYFGFAATYLLLPQGSRFSTGCLKEVLHLFTTHFRKLHSYKRWLTCHV